MGVGEGSTTVVVVCHGDVEVVVARLDASPPDLALVDALCRLHLAARRLGGSVTLRDPSPELQGLLDLVGLADLVEASGLPLQAGGEAEGDEQLGEQEVVPGGDPPP